MIDRMSSQAAARPRARADIAERAQVEPRGHLTRTGPPGKSARAPLDRRIGEYAALKGTLAPGPDRLLAAYRLNDELGQLAYKVYFYPSLRYDEDQRDNQVNARRQQVQALLARWQEATSWFSPELLTIPLETVRDVDGRESPTSPSTGSRSRKCTGCRSTCSTSKANG